MVDKVLHRTMSGQIMLICESVIPFWSEVSQIRTVRENVNIAKFEANNTNKSAIMTITDGVACVCVCVTF